MSYLNQVNFNAKIADVFDMHGKRIDREIARGVYREDTGELIAMAGPQTKIVNHMDIVAPILDHFNDLGYEIMDRPDAGNKRAFYDLIGKKGAFISTEVSHNGARARVDLVVGDFVEVTGSSSFLPTGPDTMLHRYSFLNGLDGSTAISANTSYERIICANSMVDQKWSAGIKAKHTVGLDVEALKAKIAASAEMMAEDAERFELYAKTKVTMKQAEAFFTSTIAALSNKPNGDKHFSEPLVMTLLDLFRREPDGTVFSLWNAMTAWASHHKLKANAVKLSTTLGREQKVAAAMRSKQWHELLAA
jgi:hypothetical protein